MWAYVLGPGSPKVGHCIIVGDLFSISGNNNLYVYLVPVPAPVVRLLKQYATQQLKKRVPPLGHFCSDFKRTIVPLSARSLNPHSKDLAVTQLWLCAECVAVLQWAVAEPKKRPLASP
jgi:hypothetical protein